MKFLSWLHPAASDPSQPPPPRVPLPDAPPAPQIRRHFHFSGLVQGVGFRYEARLLAVRLGLTGYVQNLSDGTVVVEAEGESGCVIELLRALESVPRFDITEVETRELPPLGTERSFRVVY